MSNEQSVARESQRVMWQRLDTPGMEICTLMSSSADPHYPHLLQGHVMVALDGAPADCRYNVWCDAAWYTRSIHVVSWIYPSEPGYHSLSLDRQDGRWKVGKLWPKHAQPERELPELAGCVDVDLGISPSTNTLPIRRLNLAVGESRELTAAWVRFPELTVEPLAQRYTRLAEHRYRYESVVSGFTAELEVNDLGLVVTYEGIWQRVAESKES